MRRSGLTLVLLGGFWAAVEVLGLGTSRAEAQMPVTSRPTYSVPSQGIVGRFSQRGGIGTTPFLGNVRGLGAYSVNYDKVSPDVKSSYRSYNRRFFRRTR